MMLITGPDFSFDAKKKIEDIDGDSENEEEQLEAIADNSDY